MIEVYEVEKRFGDRSAEKKRNRQILPWLLGFLVILTALALLSGRPW
jgi:hypothetical protein